MRAFAPIFVSALLVVGACKNEPGPSPPHAPVPAVAVEDASTTATAPAPSSAPRTSAEPVSDVCRSDADCVLSTFGGCCSNCPCIEPRAMTRSRDVGQRNVCRLVDCLPEKVEPHPVCPACVDPVREGMVARCVQSACTLVETSRNGPPAASATPAPAPVDCRNDDDCWLEKDDTIVRRPAKLRGRKVRPCKDSEHTPACEKGVCIVKVWKC